MRVREPSLKGRSLKALHLRPIKTPKPQPSFVDQSTTQTSQSFDLGLGDQGLGIKVYGIRFRT